MNGIVRRSKWLGLVGGTVLGLVAFLYLSHTREVILSPVKSSPIAQWEQRLTPVHLEIGEKAPDIELVTLDGEARSLGAYWGQEVGVLFVTSTCPYCDEIVGKIKQLKEGPNKSLLVICADGYAGADRLREKYGGPVPILVDSLNVVSQAYKVATVPQLFLLNKEGQVTDRLSGGVEVWQALERTFL